MPILKLRSKRTSREFKDLRIGRAAGSRPARTFGEILGQINWVLFVEEEFRGNHEEYYDPRNSYLNEVLDRGLGIPITLSSVYWAVAEQLGLTMVGVEFAAAFHAADRKIRPTVVCRPVSWRCGVRSSRL